MASIARTESRQDEEIRPTSEWLEDDGANILHIHLPGFSKEQLKISYVYTTHIIRVTGERQVASNKWNRFNQTYAVPQNCDVDNIRARFANGTLTITMLKSTIPPATPPKQEPKPATTQEAITPEKPADTAPPAQVSQKATAKPKEQEGFNAATTSLKGPALQEVVKDSEPQVPDQASKWGEALRAPPSSKLGYTTSKQNSLPEEDQEEIGKKRKESSYAPPEGGQESINRRKESSMVGGDGRSWLSSIKERLLEKARPSTYEGLAMEKEERRQTMINIGVASLVAVAFGAYLYYSYRSPGNAQE